MFKTQIWVTRPQFVKTTQAIRCVSITDNKQRRLYIERNISLIWQRVVRLVTTLFKRSSVTVYKFTLLFTVFRQQRKPKLQRWRNRKRGNILARAEKSCKAVNCPTAGNDVAYPCCSVVRVQATEMRGAPMTGRIAMRNGRGLFGKYVINENRQRHDWYQMQADKRVKTLWCALNQNSLQFVKFLLRAL